MANKMVVRSPDSFGNLLSKGNVLIPCQCYFNARDNILTEIIKHSQQKISPEKGSTSSKIYIKHEKNTKRHCQTKDAQTETISPQCCVCEYFRNLDNYTNKKDLWSKQFNRWWGWNLQRRKKDFLSKFRRRSNKFDNTCACYDSKFGNADSKKNCVCKSTLENSEEKLIKSSTSETNKKSVKTVKNIFELSEPYHCIPPLTTHTFKKPCTGRRKRNKYEKHLYEGWVLDMTSSESDNSIKNIKVKMVSPKMTKNKDNLHYLSMRLRKFKSEDSENYVSNKTDISEDLLEEKKISLDKNSTKISAYNLVDSKLISEMSKINLEESEKHRSSKNNTSANITENKKISLNENSTNKLESSAVVSKLVTQKSNTNLEESKKLMDKGFASEDSLENKTNNLYNNKNPFNKLTSNFAEFVSPISGKYYNFNLPKVTVPLLTKTDYLEPLDIKDETIIPKPKFDCTKQFNLIKQQHNDLLKSICNVLNKTKSPEKPTKYGNLQFETENNCFGLRKHSEIKYSTKEEESYSGNEIRNTTNGANEIFGANQYESLLSLTNKLEENCNIMKPNASFDNYPVSFATNPFCNSSTIELTTSNHYCPLNGNKPLKSNDTSAQNMHLNCRNDSNLIEDSNNDEEFEMVEICSNKDVNYDINYINNNLEYFKSSISDTEFLIGRTEVCKNLDVSENMNEEILEVIDLSK